MATVVIAETGIGMADYHLREVLIDQRWPLRAVCGAALIRDMRIPLSQWRRRLYPHEKWCPKCEAPRPEAPR